MIATLLLGLFSGLFAYLAKYRNIQWGLKLSFTLIFLFLALRYNFGNDYKIYLNAFIENNQDNQFYIFAVAGQFEPGWKFLIWLFRPLGFFALTAVLALFNCAVYYRFIKKYVPVRYYWLAIFLYIFNPGFMLIHSSAMRQSIAIMLFVFSLDYLYKKDAIRYFFCVGLALLFHISAFILLPAYLLGLFNRKIDKLIGVICVPIFVSLFLFGKSLTPYLNQFISKYFGKYEVYQDAGVVNTGLSVLYLSILFIMTLYYERVQNKETALIFKITIVSFMFIPLGLLIQLVGRVGMYFAPATIIAYPIILKNLRKPVSKTIFLALLLIFTFYSFFQFFYSATYMDDFGIYQTILSSPQWY
jgi:hypothetical protein